MRKEAFEVYGEPVGKGRPRFRMINGHASVYTPKKTSVYERQIARAYQDQCGEPFDAGIPIKVLIYAYFVIPKTASRARREMMLNGIEKPTKKPDCDNILKAVLDGLNGVAYRDDKQVVEAHIVKLYSNRASTYVFIAEALE